MTTLNNPGLPDRTSQEFYTVGYGSGAVRWLERRNAAHNAAFFMPCLRPGVALLDCGCGSGSITLGLARAVNPGRVIGIDLDAGMIERARLRATEHGVGNVEFQAASAYDLPFPDESFDAVFAHAMLEHLDKPDRALQEMRRALKPGGVIGVRSIDFGGRLISPRLDILEEYHRIWERVAMHDGRNMRIGRSLGALLRKNGFGEVRASASYDCHDTPEAIDALVGAWVEFPFLEQAVMLGWINRDYVMAIRSAFKDWGRNPDAFFGWAQGEAVGRRRKGPVESSERPD